MGDASWREIYEAQIPICIIGATIDESKLKS